MSQTRRLAAILAADVAGYSRLMGADEEGTLERLKLRAASLSIRKSPNTTAASSRPPATACWWNLPASSMRCCARSRCSRRCPSGTLVAADNRIELRIGLNLGDVIVEGDDLYGDGVNIAAR